MEKMSAAPKSRRGPSRGPEEEVRSHQGKHFKFFSLKKIFLIDFREEGEGGERD